MTPLTLFRLDFLYEVEKRFDTHPLEKKAGNFFEDLSNGLVIIDNNRLSCRSARKTKMSIDHVSGI